MDINFINSYKLGPSFKFLEFVFKNHKVDETKSPLEQSEEKYRASMVILITLGLGIITLAYTISLQFTDIQIGLFPTLAIFAFVSLLVICVPGIIWYSGNIVLAATIFTLWWIAMHSAICYMQRDTIPALDFLLVMMAPVYYFLTRKLTHVTIMQSIVLIAQYVQNGWLLQYFEELSPDDMPIQLQQALHTIYAGHFITYFFTHILVLSVSIGLSQNFDHYTELLKVLIKYAMEAEKSKYQLIASMSHEFRNPLNSMLVSVEVLKASLVGMLSQKQQQIFGAVVSCCEVLRSLINNILDVGKLNVANLEINPTTFDIRKLIMKVVTINQCTAQYKRIALGYRVQQCLPRMIKSDCDRLCQILINLVSNSLKYTNEGYVHIFLAYEPVRSTIDFRYRNAEPQEIQLPEEVFNEFNIKPILDEFEFDSEDSEEYELEDEITISPGLGQLTRATQTNPIETSETPLPQTFITSAQTNEKCLYNRETQGILSIDIIDSGTGISETELDELFTAFKQGNPAISKQLGGTGLGLCLSKQLVEKINGNITVKSKEGEGSIFTIQIPVEIPENQHDDDQPMNDCEGIDDILNIIADSKIAIAEDIHYNQMAIKELCLSIKCHVAVIPNGRDMVKFYEQYHDKLSAILMDIQMPIIDGIDATKFIRHFEKSRNLPPMPIFIVSSQTDPKVKRAAFQAGANEYFVKPLRRLDLAKSLYTYRAHLFNVLIVDEDRFSLDMTKQMLTLEGFKPLFTQHPKDVPKILSEVKVDTIIISHHLDSIDSGEKLARELRIDKYTTPIVIATNTPTQEFQEHCIEIGVNEVIEKPLSRQMLADCIRRLIINSFQF